MSSCVKPKFNDKLKEWMNHNCGKCVKVMSNRDKVHEYLGMSFDLIEKARVKIKMDDYVKRMINEFPM